MKIAKNVLDLIHSTPMIRLNRVINSISSNIFAKIEFINPSGSIKDRMIFNIIKDAEKRGLIKSDTILLEATSGNTGSALAMVAAVKGYKMLSVIPKNMANGKKKIIRAYGGEILEVDGELADAFKKVKEMAKDRKYFFIDQFENKLNYKAHMKTTAREILKQVPEVEALVAGIGTGGTLIGVAKVLKKKKPEVKIIAVEPSASPVLSGGKPGHHKIEGIGDGFIPKILKDNMGLIDKVISVSDKEAINMTKRLIREEGLLVGISSGANVFASIKFAKESGLKNIVTVLPDSGMRYLDTEVFEW